MAPRAFAALAVGLLLSLAASPVLAESEEPRVLSSSWRTALAAIGKADYGRPAMVPPAPVTGAPAPSAPDAGAPAGAGENLGRCGLLLPASDGTTSTDCLVCHGRAAHGGHAYDLEYTSSSHAGNAPLRSLDEAIRRGMFLPDRQIRCVTCHDRTSQWKYFLRVPRGATVKHAVDLRRPASYENPRSLPPPRPGDDVARKPLCLGCHAMD